MELKDVLDAFKAGKVIGRTNWDRIGIQLKHDRENLATIFMVSLPDYSELDTLDGLNAEDLIANNWVVDE